MLPSEVEGYKVEFAVDNVIYIPRLNPNQLNKWGKGRFTTFEQEGLARILQVYEWNGIAHRMFVELIFPEHLRGIRMDVMTNDVRIPEEKHLAWLVLEEVLSPKEDDDVKS